MNKRVAETGRGHMYVVLLYGKLRWSKETTLSKKRLRVKIICGLYYLNKVASVTKEK